MFERMLKTARLLTLAAGLVVVPALASAQTLIVRGLSAGQPVELQVNGAPAGTATADEAGDAILEWTLPAGEMDARIFVDICPGTHRILLTDRNLIPKPQESGCERRDVIGVFWLRKDTTTLVVRVDRPSPQVLLRQRHVTIAELDAPPVRRTVPTGLIVFGGAGFNTFRDAVGVMCGTLQTCSGDQTGIGYTAGAELWLARSLSIEGAFIRTSRPSAEGADGATFRFDGRFEPTHVLTVAGKVGVPVGPMRFYGKGGAIYYRAQLTTDQEMDEGELSTAFETRGWSWLGGGGLEGWFTPSIGLYAEYAVGPLKGKDPAGGEARTDDRLNSLFVGLRIRVLGGR